MLPTIGAEAEVPPVNTHFPPTTMMVLKPFAETSGIPQTFWVLLYLCREVDSEIEAYGVIITLRMAVAYCSDVYGGMCLLNNNPKHLFDIQALRRRC
jgi:hypothetical protein